MTARTWDGSNSNFGNATHWTPSGAPHPGDTAIIKSGVVHASSADSSSVTIDVGSDQPLSSPDLVLQDVNLGTVSLHAPSGPASGPYPTRYAAFAVSGHVVESGSLAIGTTDPAAIGIPGSLRIGLSPNASFVLTGSALEQGSSSVTVSGGAHSAFVNDGRFTDIGGTADFAVPVSGSGTFDLSRGKFAAAHVTFESGVSAGEHVNVHSSSTLTLDQPSKFLGSIAEDPFASLVLKNTAPTSASYAGGVLTLLDHGKIVASLHVGSAAGMGFAVAQSGQDTIISTSGSVGSGAVQLAQSSMATPVLTHS